MTTKQFFITVVVAAFFGSMLMAGAGVSEESRSNFKVFCLCLVLGWLARSIHELEMRSK